LYIIGVPSFVLDSNHRLVVTRRRRNKNHSQKKRARTFVASPVACAVHARVADTAVHRSRRSPSRCKQTPPTRCVVHAVVVTSLLLIVIISGGGASSLNSTRLDARPRRGPPSDARGPPTTRQLVVIDDEPAVVRTDDDDDDARIFEGARRTERPSWSSSALFPKTFVCVNSMVSLELDKDAM